MSTDRPSHDDDKFLAELAAFDELLRKPLEGPQHPPAPGPPVESPGETAAPARMGRSSLPSLDEWLTEFEEPEPLEALEAPEDVLRPSRSVAALRALSEPRPPRRSRAAALSIAALAAGVVGGGPLGWWLATNFFVSTPPAEYEARAVPASEPALAPPPAARRPSARPAAPRGAAPSMAARKDAGEVSPPAAPVMSSLSPIASGANLPAMPVAPAPSIDLPLPSAPLAVAPSMPPAAPPAVEAAGAIAAVAADERAIETTLRQYKDAYERLDAKAAVAVWPTVDRHALTRAFAGLASQSLDFRGCEVVVRAGANKATASCSGMAAYVRKVGDTRVRLEPRQWTFTLNKTQGAWRIEAVDGSR